MNALRSTFALAMLFLRPALRQPMVTVLVSALPVSFILVFRLVGGSELSRHALYGTLIVFATNVGIVSMPQLAVSYRLRRLKDMYVASPVGPLAYAAGMGLSRLLWVAPGIALIVIFLVATGGLPAPQVPAVLAVVLATWFTGVMIGFTTSTLFATSYAVGVAANLLGMVFSVLPPVYYPLELVPAPWRALALVLPTTHAAQLVRVAGGVAVASAGELALHWTALAVAAGACTWATVARSRWSER